MVLGTPARNEKCCFFSTEIACRGTPPDVERGAFFVALSWGIALVEWNAPWNELNAPLEGGWGVNPKP